MEFKNCIRGGTYPENCYNIIRLIVNADWVALLGDCVMSTSTVFCSDVLPWSTLSHASASCSRFSAYWKILVPSWRRTYSLPEDWTLSCEKWSSIVWCRGVVFGRYLLTTARIFARLLGQLFPDYPPFFKYKTFFILIVNVEWPQILFVFYLNLMDWPVVLYCHFALIFAVSCSFYTFN